MGFTLKVNTLIGTTKTNFNGNVHNVIQGLSLFVDLRSTNSMIPYFTHQFPSCTFAHEEYAILGNGRTRQESKANLTARQSSLKDGHREIWL